MPEELINTWFLTERVSPVQELLQRFYGSRYISSIDLSSAFLQVELAPECRKFTAFLFENEVFQFTRVPYGLRNSLPAFVRALNLALRADTSGFALAYVNITVFSPTFGHHLEHLRIVIDRLTRAGFTINAGKCNFCRPEISFLGMNERWQQLSECCTKEAHKSMLVWHDCQLLRIATVRSVCFCLFVTLGAPVSAENTANLCMLRDLLFQHVRWEICIFIHVIVEWL
jgi:hypothetical protein